MAASNPADIRTRSGANWNSERERKSAQTKHEPGNSNDHLICVFVIL